MVPSGHRQEQNSTEACLDASAQRSTEWTFARRALVGWTCCKCEWDFVGYINFPKMERNWARVLKFKEYDFIIFLGLSSPIWTPSWELHQVREGQGASEEVCSQKS